MEEAFGLLHFCFVGIAGGRAVCALEGWLFRQEQEQEAEE